MSSVQDHLNDENGSVAMNKATKLRRLPFSPLSRRQGNVIVVSKVSANSVSRVLKRAPARIFMFQRKWKQDRDEQIYFVDEVLIIKKPSTCSNHFSLILLKPSNCAIQLHHTATTTF
jgi:hypothetical protein